MKKLFTLLLFSSLLALCACEAFPNKASPYSSVIKAYSRFEEDLEWREELRNMDEEQRKQAFAQGFEMLPENPFEGLLNRKLMSYDGDRDIGYIFSYVLYDIGNGAEVLLLAGGDSIMDIYTIQNGIAVQLKTFAYKDESASCLLKNGALYAYHHDENDSGVVLDYYRFEDGTLNLQNRLIAGVWDYFHVGADGKEVSITKEEYVQLVMEYSGGGESAKLPWKPLKKYRH